MKFKKIMLITLLLLAVLTIGAVSASDDFASDDRTAASDNSDVIAEADEGGEEIVGADESSGETQGTGDLDAECDVDDENKWDVTDEDEDSFADVTLSSDYDGNITIVCGEDNGIVYEKKLEDIEDSDEDEGETTYSIYLLDLTNLTKFLGSETFTLTFNHIDGGSINWTYSIIYDDANKEVSFRATEDGPEEGPEFDVSAVDNFDVNNPDATVLTVYSPEALVGTFYVEFEDEEENSRVISFPVTDENWTDDVFNITVSDLGVTGNAAGYGFWIYYCAEGESIDWDDDDRFDSAVAVNAAGRDYTQFWADVKHDANLFSTEPVITFYCCEADEGTVRVDVYRMVFYDESVEYLESYSKDIADKVENFIYWNSTDLGLEAGNGYWFNITCGDWGYDEECLFYDPVEFNEEISYIGSDDEGRIGILSIAIPSGMGGNITIIVNGTSIWLNTDMFEKRDEDTELDELYWEYFRPRGSEHKDIKVYFINNQNLKGHDEDYTQEIEYEFEKGVYDITVILYVDGSGLSPYTCQGNVTVSTTNTKEDGDVSITFYEQDTFSVWEDEFAFVDGSFPEGDDRRVVVTVDGRDDPIYEYELENDDDGFEVYPCDLKLPQGTYEITVALFDGDNQILNHTATLSFDYGEAGFMRAYVPDEMMYYDGDSIRIYFATDEVDGVVKIVIDGVEYFRQDVDPDSLEIDEEDGFLSLYVSLEDFNEEIEPGEYGLVEITYVGNDGTRGYSDCEDFKVLESTPSIWIPDWSVCVLDNDDVIYVYPRGDESDDIRIALTIGDEVYLNGTVEELGLELKEDDDGHEYYGIGAGLLNRQLSIGQKYEDVIAYYYSDNFNVTSNVGDDPNTSLICVGMLKEVEYTYNGTVISVYFYGDDIKRHSKIIVDIRDREGITYEIQDGDKDNFINWNLDDLGLYVGYNDFVEISFEDGDVIFGGDIWVVNSSDFRAKTRWNVILYGDPTVISVWCPQGSEGKTIGLYDKNNDKRRFMEYTIKENDQARYIDFTLSDLGIDESGWYDLNFTVDGEEIVGDYGCNVHDLIEFNQNGVVTMSDDESLQFDSMIVATLYLPYDFKGDVVITANGHEVLDEDLENIDYDEDNGCLRYTIYSSDLDDIDKDKYEIVITLEGGISKSAEMTFADLNYKSSEDIGIEMIPLDITYSDEYCDSYWNTYFAVLYTPCEGYDWGEVQVTVMLNDEEYTVRFDENEVWRNDIWDEDKIVGYMYYIRPGDIRDSEGNSNIWGNFNVTVIYDEGGENELRNNGTLKVTKMPSIRVCFTGDWEKRIAEYFLNQDITIIHIHYYDENLDLEGIRVVLTSGDEILIDDILTNLDYSISEQDDDGYLASLHVSNLKDVGHYDDVVAVLQMGDYQTRSDVYDDACTSFDVYWGQVDIHVDENGKYLPDGELVDIYAPVDADGDIVVMIGDDVYFEGTLKSLGEIRQYGDDIENNAGHYYLYLSNMSIPILPGHYSNFIVSYNGYDGYLTDNTKSWDSRDYIDVFGDSSIEFSQNIAFITGNSGSTTITLVGATVSEDNITVEGHPEAEIEIEGNVITVSNLTSGEYDLKVTTTPINDYFYSVDGYTKIFVSDTKFDPNFSIFVDDVVAGNPVVVEVSADDAFSGVVTVNVDGNDVLVSVKNGYGINDTTGVVVLPFGDNYVASLTFEASDLFNEDDAETTFDVIAIDPDFNIFVDDVVAGNPVVVEVSADDAFSGVVTVNVDGIDVLVSVEDGYGVNDTTGVVLPFGDNYVASLTFEATDVFSADTAETTFDVIAIDPDFSISIDDVVAGNPVVVEVSADDAFSGVVIVNVDGIDVLVSVEDGYGVNDTTGIVLPFGDNYVASLTFEATDVFSADTAETTFNVTAIDPDLAVGQIADIEEGNSVAVVVTANENFTGNFKVLIGDNVVANGAISAGRGNAVIAADKLAVGTVTIKVTTEATDIFSAGMQTTSFKVNAKVVPARIIANDASVMYTSGTLYSVTVYGTDGALAKNTAVVIKINGKAVATVKTNDKGVATYKIVQAPGSYRITAEALGISVTKKLTVKHLLKLKKVKVKRSAKKLVIKVTLNKVNGKYLKGKKITLKFKGKKYKAKTNKKGVAKFTIKRSVLKKLKVGKKVKYQATYLKDTVKYTVKVKK